MHHATLVELSAICYTTYAIMITGQGSRDADQL